MSNSMKRTHPHHHDFYMGTAKNCAALPWPLGHPCACECEDTPDVDQDAGVRGVTQKHNFFFRRHEAHPSMSSGQRSCPEHYSGHDGVPTAIGHSAPVDTPRLHAGTPPCTRSLRLPPRDGAMPRHVQIRKRETTARSDGGGLKRCHIGRTHSDPPALGSCASAPGSTGKNIGSSTTTCTLFATSHSRSSAGRPCMH